MNRERFDNVHDLVDVTIKDLYHITVVPDFKKGIINVSCYLFGKDKTIELPFAELMLYADSAKSFINYLKEKVTEGLKEMYHG